MTTRAMLGFIALALLNAILVVGDAIETRWALVPAQLALELVLFFALAWFIGRHRRVLPRALTWCIAILLAAALLLRIGDIAVPWYFGRAFNALVDLAYLGFALGLLRGSVSTMHVLGFIAAAIAAMIVLVMLLRWLIVFAWHIGSARNWRPALALVGAALLAFLLVPARYDLTHAVSWTVAGSIFDHTGKALDALGITATHRRVIDAAIAARPPAQRLDGLGHRHVLLIFVESYGMIAHRDPDLARELAPTWARWRERVIAGGYHAASATLDSPISGGGSWLAHATLNFGVRIDSQPLFDALLARRSSPLGAYFRAAGYRTVAVQPRMQQPWLIADAFGFDSVLDDAALAYRGPRFAWETSPDQFVLEQLHRRELAESDGRPRFVMVVTSSSHAPFDRVPPLVDDGASIGNGTLYATLASESHPPPGGRIFDNRAGYGAAMRYALGAVERYLADRLADDSLVIVLGDHQPPLTLAAATRDRSVPIHVLSRDRRLVAPLLARGFVAGLMPDSDAASIPMERFLDVFLAAFASRLGG
jgi:hypothetical protein